MANIKLELLNELLEQAKTSNAKIEELTRELDTMKKQMFSYRFNETITKFKQFLSISAISVKNKIEPLFQEQEQGKVDIDIDIDELNNIYENKNSINKINISDVAKEQFSNFKNLMLVAKTKTELGLDKVKNSIVLNIHGLKDKLEDIEIIKKISENIRQHIESITNTKTKKLKGFEKQVLKIGNSISNSGTNFIDKADYAVDKLTDGLTNITKNGFSMIMGGSLVTFGIIKNGVAKLSIFGDELAYKIKEMYTKSLLNLGLVVETKNNMINNIKDKTEILKEDILLVAENGKNITKDIFSELTNKISKGINASILNLSTAGSMIIANTNSFVTTGLVKVKDGVNGLILSGNNDLVAILEKKYKEEFNLLGLNINNVDTKEITVPQEEKIRLNINKFDAKNKVDLIPDYVSNLSVEDKIYFIKNHTIKILNNRENKLIELQKDFNNLYSTDQGIVNFNKFLQENKMSLSFFKTIVENNPLILNDFKGGAYFVENGKQILEKIAKLSVIKDNIDTGVETIYKIKQEIKKEVTNAANADEVSFAQKEEVLAAIKDMKDIESEQRIEKPTVISNVEKVEPILDIVEDVEEKQVRKLKFGR